MKPELWKRVEDFFSEAVDLPAEQRAERLDGIQKTDPDLYSELKVLIAAHDEVDELLGGFENLISEPVFVPPSDPVPRLNAALEGRYVLNGELGRGGMATVYLADDLKHERKVAFKVLRPELAAVVGAERFLAEIKTTANLQHPHILPLFDSGEADGFLFYVMPHVEGESLRQRLDRDKQLPVDDAVEITRHVARALGYAHDHNVIHLDIKPENILLAGDEAVVADFGIARIVHVAEGAALTLTGMSVGTPVYMSPEQAAGESQLDARSDIYSLAAMLYEMLAGEPPYTGRTAQVILKKRFVGPVPSVLRIRDKVPASIDATIQQALAPVPADRYATASDFVKALNPSTVAQVTGPAPLTRRAIGFAAAAVLAVTAIVAVAIIRTGGSVGADSEIPRLVVLPLENLGGSEDDYFADGMTEEIIARLAGLSGLRVIARQTAIQYKGSTLSALEIGEELNVDYVLEGTVRMDRAPDGSGQVRITPQLIRASDETHLWAEPFTVALIPGEIFRIQAEIAARIAEGMDVVLLEREQEANALGGTADQEAYDYYLRGMSYGSRGRRRLDDYRLAADMFERAVAEDPNYLEARRMLAHNYQTIFREFRQFDAAPKAVDAFERANDLAQLAPDHPASDMARGEYHQFLTQAFDLAEQHYRAARQARPNDASVLAALAAVQAAQGRGDESTTTYEEALSLDPRSGGILQILARRYTHARRYAEAEAYFDRGIVLEPDNPWHYFFKTLLYLYWDGSTERAQGVLEAAAGRADVLSFTLVSWDFDDELVLRIFADHFDDALERRTLYDPADSAAYYFAKGDAAGRNGTGATAAAYYDSARVVLERGFELESELPTSGIGQNFASGELGRGTVVRSAAGPLGLAYARLGNREAARRMVAGIPANEFSLETPTEIYLLIGDYEAAVDLLERLSGVRPLLSVPLLRIDPLWDPLRDHPRFQALLARGEN